MALTKKRRNFLPTKPCRLPYPGAPLNVQDMIMRQVRLEDTGIEGFRRDESHYEPEQMMKEVEVNKKPDAIKRNWFAANIHAMIA